MCFQEPGVSCGSMQSAWPSEMDAQTAILWSGLPMLLTTGKTGKATFLRNIHCGRVNKQTEPKFSKKSEGFYRLMHKQAVSSHKDL